MKIVYSDAKTGRSAQAELTPEISVYLINKRINEEVDGSPLGLTGYKLRITGGSDDSGFPMSKNIHGSMKTRVIRERKSGKTGRITVVGNVITPSTAQVNMVITDYGSKPVDEIFPQGAKAKELKEGEEKK